MAQAPVISSFSPDTGDSDTTDQDVLSLVGTAPDDGTVDIYSGSTLLGTTMANGSGAWSFTTPTLADGAYSFTATDVVSGVTSAASAPLDVNVVPATTVTGVKSSASGTEFAGQTMTLTVDMSAAVTVTGTPTLTLNDGGTATYAGGSGTDAITFTYTVGSVNITVPTLAITSVDLPTGAMITDGNGDAAVMSGATTSFSGLGVDAYNDGAANAPAGTPQFATLLSGEAVRPPWQVAGVNYAVGVPAGTVLKDPMTINMAGVSLDVADHIVNVTGNNVVLSGYDFSLEGGWEVSVNGGSGTIIEDDNFKVGSTDTNSAIYVSPSASNVTIEYNNIDGQGLPGEAGYINQVQFGVALNGGGNTTLEYNYIHDWWGEDVVTGSFADGENWLIEYNVIANAGEGFNEGAHGDMIQSYNNATVSADIITNSRTIDYNTFIQSEPGSLANTQGISEAGQWGTNGIATDAIDNNTFALAAGAIVTYPIIEDTTHLVNSATIENNYINMPGAYYGWDFVGDPSSGTNTGPYNGTVTDYGNVDMSTGTPLDAAATTVTSVVASAASGVETPGETVKFTMTLSAAVTVTGTPTLTLNDGGTATYKSGSGTDQLVFTYGVGSSDSTVSALAINSLNLPSSASITDSNGNPAVMTGAITSFSGLEVDTAPTTPTIVSIEESPSSGDLNAGKTVTLTLLMGEAMTVTGGTPTLTLNDGGTATYSGGSGTNALAFSYTVAAGQNTSALAVTSVNLPAGTTIETSSGSAAGLSLTGLTQTGPQIDTTAPAAPVISGDTVSVNTVTLTGTAQANSTTTVFDSSTQLGTATTNSSGAWTFTTGALANGSQSFTATATDGAGNVSAASSAFVMTLTAPVNLVVNGNFGTDSFSGWTLGGNYTSTTYGPEIFIDTDAEGSSTYAAGMGSVGSDGTLSQTIATTAGQTYTLSFWLQNEASGTNDFSALWNGQTLLSLSNAAKSGYTEYTYSVTATGSITTLEFSAANGPSQWDLDNVSLTANSTTPPDPPAAPVISAGVANSNESVTLKGTAPDGSTVTVSDGGTTALGTATASSTGAWSFTTADLSAASYAFTATDTTSAGTSAASSPFDVTVLDPPAAPVISTGAANSNASVTLTGTAPDGSTVTVSDGGATALGTATASSTGAWSFTTADLSAASYAFTATDTTSAGTSAASSAFDVTVTSSSPPPPAAPVISTGVANSNESVTLTGTAPDGSTVTVSDGGTTALGTATASSTGAWSFTTADLSAGSYAFTATDTTSAGASAASSPFDVTVTSSSPPSSGSNLVANGNFATGDFTDWTLGGNSTSTTYGPEIFIDTDAEGSSTYAAGMGSVGSDGTLSQTIATTAGQTYTLSFWLQNEASGTNDFSAIWNGQTLLSLSNAAQSGYTEYTYAVTATGSTTTLEFSAANGPSQWDLDNVSLTANSAPPGDPPAAPVISTGVENSNESVTLTGTALDGSTVTVSDGGTTALGTATASSTGAWSFTTADLSAGSYAFTATDTTSAGTSAASSPFDVTVTSSSPPPSSSNLVANSNFATGNFTDWTLGGNYTSTFFGPEIFIDTNAEGGSTYAAGMGSVGSDGTLSQTIATTAGQTYTLSFWLQNEASGTNDFSAMWNGQTLLSLSNAAQSGYTEYTYIVTATGGTTTLEFSAANGPSQWELDNVSLTAGPSGSATIGTGATLELAAADSGSVTFNGSTGTLILESPSTFSGEIFNFTGNGSLSGSDQIDLTNINFNSVKDSYANGVLTVTDGSNTDKLDFNGSYKLANFDFASDGSGGTIVYDPPVPTSNASVPTSSGPTVTACERQTGGPATIATGATLELGGACSEAVTFSGPTGTLVLGSSSISGGQSSNFAGTVSGFGAQDVIDLPGIAFDAQTTLGYLLDRNQTGGTLSLAGGAQSAKIALLGNYMASSFAVASDHHDGTVITEAWQASNQALLTHPQHA